MVQKQPMTVMEGGSVVISADHLNASFLQQSIKDVLRQDTTMDVSVSFVVKETPTNGVLQVTLDILGFE